MSTQTQTQDRNDKKRRGGMFVKVGIASLAILGIGGALTTAMWSQDVTFTGGGSTEAFSVLGRLGHNTQGEWQSTLHFGDEFMQLSPHSDSVAIPFEIRNDGTVPVDVSVSLATEDGLFAGWENWQGAFDVQIERAALSGQTTRSGTIHFDPANIPVEAAGTSGTITVTVSGTQAALQG